MANMVLVCDKEMSHMTKILQSEYKLENCCWFFNVRLILCSFKNKCFINGE